MGLGNLRGTGITDLSASVPSSIRDSVWNDYRYEFDQAVVNLRENNVLVAIMAPEKRPH